LLAMPNWVTRWNYIWWIQNSCGGSCVAM
jgi:hypothetical protein